MITTKAELNRYFEMIDRRVPIGVSRFIRWLRIPSSFAVRLAIAVLLILGGIFSFLPILGIWMLPLGLLLIAQDVERNGETGEACARPGHSHHGSLLISGLSYKTAFSNERLTSIFPL
jgi:hypothetical protein